ncbi:hypothetical protein TrRE_jg11154 [Triparma retinervis]|jgi:nucleoside-diphosphate kinase|uniref:DM10 domain-containing protein n=1 Tax=Triparma retinervis TaxID=2557542 RepID=A0A9W7DZY0_9STRA|nr:hypothetical protein TrRE_jg11154 [Triparma retinervis]
MPAPSGVKDEILGFVAEWYDPRPQLVKTFLLKYYSATHDAELIDIKAHRCFLKRSKLPSSVFPSDFNVGNPVLIYGRELKIVDYADPQTRKKLSPVTESTVVFCLPEVTPSFGSVVQSCEEAGLRVSSLKTIALAGGTTLSNASVLLGVSPDALTSSTGVSMVVEFKGQDSVQAAQRVLAKYGPGVICANSEGAGRDFSELFLEAPSETTATFDSCTCCLIKPHAVKAGSTGGIIDTILSQGYEISAMQSFLLDRAVAGEFFEVYKGVVENYGAHVDELTTGKVVAIEVRAEDAVTTFRKTCGPYDVEMAKELAPKTIRGQHGVDNIRNAVHCTDLPTDGVNECDYFFNVLNL